MVRLAMAPLMALGVSWGAGAPATALQTVPDVALRWQRPPGAPRHSDVCFSMRWMRAGVDPFEKIALFHVTRFDWVYATREFISECSKRGCPISHCTSPCRPDNGPGEGRSTDVEANRKILCLAYCLGQNFVAPWDVWIKGSERFYGEPQDYDHLFAFVRDNARWFDGYEYAAAVGECIRDEWCGDRPPVVLAGNEDACAFVRAVPGGRDMPVVVHLYDWGKEAKPFRVMLDNARFLRGRGLTCRLLTPARRGADDHARAEETKDFSKFTCAADIPCASTEGHTVLEVPALEPWAMLLVSPAERSES